MKFFVRDIYEPHEEIRVASRVTLEEFDLVLSAAADQNQESLPAADERKSNTFHAQEYGMRKTLRALRLLLQNSSVTQYLVS